MDIILGISNNGDIIAVGDAEIVQVVTGRQITVSDDLFIDKNYKNYRIFVDDKSTIIIPKSM